MWRTFSKAFRDTRQMSRYYKSGSFWIWRATSEAFAHPSTRRPSACSRASWQTGRKTTPMLMRGRARNWLTAPDIRVQAWSAPPRYPRSARLCTDRAAATGAVRGRAGLASASAAGRADVEPPRTLEATPYERFTTTSSECASCAISGGLVPGLDLRSWRNRPTRAVPAAGHSAKRPGAVYPGLRPPRTELPPLEERLDQGGGLIVDRAVDRERHGVAMRARRAARRPSRCADPG